MAAGSPGMALLAWGTAIARCQGYLFPVGPGLRLLSGTSRRTAMLPAPVHARPGPSGVRGRRPAGGRWLPQQHPGGCDEEPGGGPRCVASFVADRECMLVCDGGHSWGCTCMVGCGRVTQGSRAWVRRWSCRLAGLLKGPVCGRQAAFVLCPPARQATRPCAHLAPHPHALPQ